MRRSSFDNSSCLSRRSRLARRSRTGLPADNESYFGCCEPLEITRKLTVSSEASLLFLRKSCECQKRMALA